LPYFIADKSRDGYIVFTCNFLDVTYVKATAAMTFTFTYNCRGKCELWLNGVSQGQNYYNTKSVSLSLVQGWNEIAITNSTHNDGLVTNITTALSTISGIERMTSGYIATDIDRRGDLLLAYPQTIANNPEEMFYYCIALKSLDLRSFNFSIVTKLYYTFAYSMQLTDITFGNKNDFSNIVSMTSAFNFCSSLTNLDALNNIRVGFNLLYSTKLTHDSIVNIIAGLADMTLADNITWASTNSVTATPTLTLGSTNLAKLSDSEKAIATAKNWTLA
jgi:surface protein